MWDFIVSIFAGIPLDFVARLRKSASVPAKCPQFFPVTGSVAGKVLGVEDGNTFRVLCPRTNADPEVIRVRVHGLIVPALHNGGAAAREALLVRLVRAGTIETRRVCSPGMYVSPAPYRLCDVYADGVQL